MGKSTLRMLVLSVAMIALLTGLAPLANASVMYGGTIPAFNEEFLNLNTWVYGPLRALTAQQGPFSGATFFNDLRLSGGSVAVLVTLVDSRNWVGDNFVNGPGFRGGPLGPVTSFDSLDDPLPVPTATTVPDSTSSLWLVLPAMFLIAVKRYKFQGSL
jgi:hypothetical protein